MTRQDYLIEVHGTSLWKEISQKFIKEGKQVKTINEALKFTNKWCMFLYYDSSIHTIKNRSKEMRDLLSESNLNNLIDGFRIDASIYGLLKQNYKDKIKGDLEVSNSKESIFNHLEFTQNEIKKLEERIKNKDLIMTSNSANEESELFYLKLFLLGLATGRRQIELLQTLEISKKKDLAVFKGLSKKRDEKEFFCEAPILIDIFEAKKLLSDVREYLSKYGIEKMNNNQINSKFNGRIGVALKRYIGNYTFHYLRSCYAHTCFELYGGNEEKALYFQKILGHKEEILPAYAYTSK